MQPTIMMALDTSTKCTGIAIFHDGVLYDTEIIDLSKMKTMDERFHKMAVEIWSNLDIACPNIVWVEEMVVTRNASTARFLTMMLGVVYAWCMLHHVEFNTIRPTTWRKHLGFKQGKGYGRELLKQQSVDYVKNNYKIECGDDMADAICIGSAVLKMLDSTANDD